MQIVSGSLVSAAGYLLSIAVTGQEFSWTDFIIATAMGAATATIMVIGGKIVKTIKTAQVKRAERIDAERKYQQYCKSEYKEFDSYYEFKKQYGKAGEGYEWHHIVEQNQVNKGNATPQQIYNTKNTIRLDYDSHRKISAIYSSKPNWTGGLTVRQWMSTQPYNVQYEKGIELLNSIGVKI